MHRLRCMRRCMPGRGYLSGVEASRKVIIIRAALIMWPFFYRGGLYFASSSIFLYSSSTIRSRSSTCLLFFIYDSIILKPSQTQARPGDSEVKYVVNGASPVSLRINIISVLKSISCSMRYSHILYSLFSQNFIWPGVKPNITESG